MGGVSGAAHTRVGQQKLPEKVDKGERIAARAIITSTGIRQVHTRYTYMYVCKSGLSESGNNMLYSSSAILLCAALEIVSNGCDAQ